MYSETITLHTMTTFEGVEIRYARLLRKHGRTTVGQSVRLELLTVEQLDRAKEVHSTQWQP
jgi:hypothetical protein